MSVTASEYGKARMHLSGDSWLANNIRVALTTGYTPNQDTHEFWSDVVANEIAGTGGYTTNGQALGTKVATYDAGTNKLKLSAAASVWTATAMSATRAVIYDRTPATDATRPLIAYIDFGGTIAITHPTGQAYTITWDAAGITVTTVA